MAVLLVAVHKQGTGYQAQPGAIQTRWTNTVSPSNALKKNYPRPQLQRKNWTNLNGLWIMLLQIKIRPLLTVMMERS